MKIQKNLKSKKSQILNQTILTSGINVLFQVIGLYYLKKIIDIFGATTELDAYYYTMSFYLILIAVFQNYFKIILTPALVKELESNRANVVNFQNKILSVSTVVLLFLTLLIVLFSQTDYLYILLPQNSNISLYQKLFLYSSPILYLTIILGIFSSIFNSKLKFGLIEFISGTKIIIALIILILLHTKFSYVVLILGNVISLVVVNIIVFIYLHKKEFINFKFDLKIDKSLLMLLKTSSLPLISGIISSLQPIVSNYLLLSNSSKGSLTLFNIIQKFGSIPSLVFTSGFLTVFISHISKFEAENDYEKVKSSITQAISNILTINLPLIILFYLVKNDFLLFLLGDTKLNNNQIDEISVNMLWVLISLLFLQIYSVLWRVLVIKNEYKLILNLSLFNFFFSFIFFYILTKYFNYEIFGIVLSTFFVNASVLVYTIIYINKKYFYLDYKYLLLNFYKTFLSALITYIVYNCTLIYIEFLFSSYVKIVSLFVSVFIFCITYISIQYALKQKDIIYFVNIFFQKFKLTSSQKF